MISEPTPKIARKQANVKEKFMLQMGQGAIPFTLTPAIFCFTSGYFFAIFGRLTVRNYFHLLESPRAKPGRLWFDSAQHDQEN
jgi:hypothetical protein